MALWKWVLTNRQSDVQLGGSYVLDYLEMDRFPDGTEGELLYDIPFNSERAVDFISPPFQPGVEPWWQGTPETSPLLRLYVTTANANITARANMRILNADGVLLQAFGASHPGDPPWAPMSIGGNKSFTVLAPFIDILIRYGYRVGMRIDFARNDSLSGDGIIGISFGDPNTDYAEVPITVADSQIIWNGNSINFPNPLSQYRVMPATGDRVQDVSGGGVVNTNLRHTFDAVRLALDNFSDADFYYGMLAWWSWAVQGKQFAFALDSADKVDTTLAASAGVGAVTLTVLHDAGFTNGRRYRIRRIGEPEQEFFTLTSHSSGSPNDTLTIPALKYSYPSGAIVRSVDYWPSMIYEGAPEFPVMENPGLTYSLSMKLREDFG